MQVHALQSYDGTTQIHLLYIMCGAYICLNSVQFIHTLNNCCIAVLLGGLILHLINKLLWCPFERGIYICIYEPKLNVPICSSMHISALKWSSFVSRNDLPLWSWLLHVPSIYTYIHGLEQHMEKAYAVYCLSWGSAQLHDYFNVYIL